MKQLKLFLKGFCVAFRVFVFVIIGFQNKISFVAHIEKKWGMAIWMRDSQAR